MNVAVNLYEYLKENDSAELVGLGTFYVSTQSARISSLTGEIRPPCRKLTFKAEENNDMSFVINMAEKEFISHETALVWVKQYAESLKEKIRNLEAYQGTFMGSALGYTYEAVTSLPYSKNEVILISDGLPYGEQASPAATAVEKLAASNILFERLLPIPYT